MMALDLTLLQERLEEGLRATLPIDLASFVALHEGLEQQAGMAGRRQRLHHQLGSPTLSDAVGQMAQLLGWASEDELPAPIAPLGSRQRLSPLAAQQ